MKNLFLCISSFLVLCAFAFAQSDSYFYEQQEVPLTLDPSRIAIHKQTDQGVQISIVTLDAGISVPQEISKRELDAENVFVSPIFKTPQGEMIITQYSLAATVDGISEEQAKAVFASHGFVIQRKIGNKIYQLRYVSSKNGFHALAQTNELAQKTDIKFAEPDAFCTGSPNLDPTDAAFKDGLTWGIHNFGQDGGVADIDMDGPEAWDITTGDPSIIIAILDTGVQQDHPDLHQIPGTDVTSECALGPCDGSPRNSFEKHGTTVAGCLTAAINNANSVQGQGPQGGLGNISQILNTAIGTVGIAPNCVIASIRTFIGIDNNGGWAALPSWTCDALAWAQSIGARVTNNSNVYGFTSAAIDQMYADTRAMGMVHFAAAGNKALPIISYPASIASVNAVSAVTRTGARANFSNYGTGLAFCAPGQTIYTTDRTGNEGYNSSSYVSLDGTSYASPYAAGVAALLLSEYPALDAASVELLMQSAATDLGAVGYDTEFGWGLVNAQQTLSLATSYLINKQ